MKLPKFIKYAYIVLYKFCFSSMYVLLNKWKRQDNEKAVIVLSRSKVLEGNLQFICKELTNHIPKSKIHLVRAENKMNLRLFKEIPIIANAKYLILDDYYLPIYLLNPSPNLKVIQLWHAAGAFKKFGYSTVGTKFGPDPTYLKLVPVHSNYTHVYVSAKSVVKYYAEAFRMSENRIFPLGIPRTDLFSDRQMQDDIRKNIFADYPELKTEKKVNILFAPTYRAHGAQGESSLHLTECIIRIADKMDEGKRIIFKPHPYMSKREVEKLSNCKNIFVAGKYSINEWMLVADAFVTDYSSAVFEFALLKRPLAHMILDKEEYENNRGFYQPIERISDGAILKDEAEVVQWINVRKKEEFYDTSRMIHYNFDHIENVSQKIVSHFLDGRKEAD